MRAHSIQKLCLTMIDSYNSNTICSKNAFWVCFFFIFIALKSWEINCSIWCIVQLWMGVNSTLSSTCFRSLHINTGGRFFVRGIHGLDKASSLHSLFTLAELAGRLPWKLGNILRKFLWSLFLVPLASDVSVHILPSSCTVQPTNIEING